LIAIDPVEVRKILIDAARARTLLTYSQALGLLGHRFTRLLMRQLCSVLDAIDEDGQAADEPGPAVLVVRQSDRLPGQGWFVSRSQSGEGFPLEWVEAEAQAKAYVAARQRQVYNYWA